jgi:hypothetical protein
VHYWADFPDVHGAVFIRVRQRSVNQEILLAYSEGCENARVLEYLSDSPL